MDRTSIFTFVLVFLFVAGFGISDSIKTDTEATTDSYIVQGTSLPEVIDAVASVDAEITHELGIINAVAAKLDDEQRDALQASGVITQISADGAVTTAGGTAGGAPSDYSEFPTLVNADAVHTEGLTGQSVTVAVLDSGMAAVAELQKDTNGNGRMAGTLQRDQGPGRRTPRSATATARTSPAIMFNTDYADDGTMRATASCRTHRSSRSRPSTVRAGHLRERDPRSRLDPRAQGRTQHPRTEPVVQRTGTVSLLGRPDQPGRHAALAGRASSWSPRPATPAPSR